MAVKKKGLGKGLDSLIPDNRPAKAEPAKEPAKEEVKTGEQMMNINMVEPNREQPRKEFDSEALSELADSISQHGVLQPLLLRPLLTGGYRIVAGERRWRAARMAGLTEVPAVIREMTDAEEMLFALIENLQREDLTPLEEARGYRTLIETQDFTQEEVSQAVGKSRPAITNALRLLNLPQDIQQMLENGEITAGHARTLLSFKTEEGMRLGAKKAKEGASVRELEALAKRLNEEKEGPVKAPRKNQYYEEAQLAVGEYLNRKVKVAGSKKKGTLQIEFYGEEDLQNLLHDLHMN